MGLKHARLSAGLTQVELAAIAAVDQRHISNLETGRVRNPSWDVVRRLSQALDVPPDTLFPAPAADSLTSEQAHA